QFNGNISGMRWKTAGDGEERAFGFKYDAANRLLKADFARNTGSWTRDNIINFDVQMGDGATAASAYDENGNIKAMTQYGMKGPSTSGLLDLLTYTYKQTNEASNQLLAVTEDISINTTNNKLGDFTDKNRTPDDYDYDLNGNLRYDNNKKITSIEYNHLNLPWKITVKNDDGTSKGTIIYIYDASGNKLEKRTNELASSYNSNTAKQTATAYTGGFVYENNKLQFFGHEEGRVRFKQFIDGSNQPQTTYIFDYFLKDHLGNTRMVLTEEQQTDIYQAGMETTNRNFEVALFGNKINTTAQTPKPSGFDVDGANQVVSKLNGTSAENRVGPGVLLKVMAGDKFNAKTQAWYLPTAMDNTTDNSLQNIVANLLGQLTPSVIAAGKGTTAINATNTILQPGVENLLNSQAPASGAPKAYLNWILLDEKTFTSVANGFVSIPVITGTMQKQLLQVNSGNDVSITKNSYLYVYVSNESKGNVYFDDIRIEHKRGAMLEETHYYPFGLTMSGISSKAAGGLENKKGYNGNEIQNKEFSDGSGLELYDFNARTYDQQTGRFIQVDPLDDEGEQESLSPYHFGENNPIRYNDPDGRCPNCITGAIGAGLGALIGGGIEIVSQLYNNGSVNNWTSVGGAALQGGITGGAAGLTGGASLLTTTAVAGAANAVGGTANRAIQGQSTTAKDVIVDATIGAGLGAAGKVVGNVVKGAVNNLSNAAKGKLGEAVTQIKYGAQGYKSTGKAVVETGGKTATGRVQVAKYDHAMKNVITGKQLTVESKFNGSTLTRNQTAAQSNITTTRGLIISRTTSQQLGNGAKAATVAAGAGAAAQKNINN
ncbi:MAG: RHS repeat-associated core domain-containing protein, partial [Ferruginibacter sp.]